MANEIIWTISQEPLKNNLLIYNDQNELINISDDVLNEEFLNLENDVILRLPYHYFNKYYFDIELNKGSYTYGKIFNIIYDFYNSNIKENELEELLKTIEKNVYDRYSEYYAASLILDSKSNMLNGNKIKRINIVSKSCTYGGIKKINDIRYELVLEF